MAYVAVVVRRLQTMAAQGVPIIFDATVLKKVEGLLRRKMLPWFEVGLKVASGS